MQMSYVKQKHWGRLTPCGEDIGGKCTGRDEKTFKMKKRAKNTGNHVQDLGKKYGADESL